MLSVNILVIWWSRSMKHSVMTRYICVRATVALYLLGDYPCFGIFTCSVVMAELHVRVTCCSHAGPPRGTQRHGDKYSNGRAPSWQCNMLDFATEILRGPPKSEALGQISSSAPFWQPCSHVFNIQVHIYSTFKTAFFSAASFKQGIIWVRQSSNHCSTSASSKESCPSKLASGLWVLSENLMRVLSVVSSPCTITPFPKLTYGS